MEEREPSEHIGQTDPDPEQPEQILPGGSRRDNPGEPEDSRVKLTEGGEEEKETDSQGDGSVTGDGH
jgi:hypothetical protein